MLKIHRRPDGRRGMVLIWVALLLLVLVGFIGLALDWGYVVWTGQKLQNAADAAALAGAQKIKDGATDVNDAAIYLASANEAAGASVTLDRNDEDNLESGEVVVGVYDREERTFTPTTSSPNAVRVLARRTVSAHGGAPLFFGPIFGKDSANVSRFAIAMSTAGPAFASVIALDDDDRRSFYVDGTPILDVGDGAVQVNSDHSTAAAVLQGSSAQLIAGQVNVVGGFATNGNPADDFTLNEGADYVVDPLLGLDVPPDGPPGSRDDGTQVNKIAGTGTYEPGYYPQGLDLNNSEHATLNPGIYVLAGTNAFRIRGQARLTGEHVMFYIKSGTLHVNGGGDIRISPPVDGDYQGISFFQARGNTNDANFNGDGTMGGYDNASDGTGVLYFPSALLQVGGTNSTYVDRLIAKNIEVYGTGIKKVIAGYDSNEGNNVVFLVE